MSGLNDGPLLDKYLHTQYEVIRLVHENLDAIRAVASHLTPVEDLADFQEEVSALYAKLGVLTTASELILDATPQGIAVLTAANAAAQRQLLELQSAALHEASHFATAAALAAANAAIAELDTQLDAVLAELATRASAADLTVLTTQVSGHGSAIDDIIAQATVDRDGVTVLVGRVTTLETELASLETGQAASTTAIQNLTSRTQLTEDGIETQGQLITSLSSRVTDMENDVEASSLAVQTLTTQVTQHGADITANSEATTLLASRVTDTETGVAGNATALDTLTTEVSAINGQLVVASEDITALKAEITSTGNLAPNAGFEADVHGWSIFNRGAGWEAAQLGRDLDAATMLPLNTHALSVTVPGQPSGALGIKSDNLPIRGGQRYILSGYLAALNCAATLEWRLLDQAGQVIQLGTVGSARVGGTTNLNDWPRLWGEIPAAADARAVQIQVWVQVPTAAGPKLWLLRPMLEEVSSLQDGPSPWVSGVSGLASSFAEAVSSLTVRVEATEAELLVQAQDLTTLEAQLNDPVTGLPATADALDSLTVRVTNTETTNTAQANQITNLQTDVAGKASTSALQALDTRVTTTEQDIDAQASLIAALDAEVDGKASAGALQALDTRVTATENTNAAQATSITNLNASLSGGGNLLRNTEFVIDSQGWEGFGYGPLAAGFSSILVNLAGNNYRPTGTNNIGVFHSGTPGADTAYVIYQSGGVPVEATKRYCFSAYALSHRGAIFINIAVYNSAGTEITGASSWTYVAGADMGAAKLADLTRLHVFHVMPADAATASVRIFCAGDNRANPYYWITRPMFEVVGTSQSQPSMYSPGGNELVPRVQANADATTALTTRVTNAEGSITSQASQITTLRASVNSGNNMISNPSFAKGLTGWQSFGTQGPTSDASSGTFLHHSANAGNTYTDQTISIPPGVEYTASADVYLSNLSPTAIVQLIFRDAADNGLSSAQSVTPTGVGAWLRVSATGVSPANTAKVTVRLLTSGGTSDTYWRRVKLERGGVATTYTDERTLSGNVTLTEALDVRATTIEQNGNGVNLLPNTEPRNGYSPWTASGGALAFGVNYAGDQWTPPGMYSFGIHHGVNGSNAYGWYDAPVVPVVAGQKYIFSVYAETHRGLVYTEVVWLDSSSNAISVTNGTSSPGGATASNLSTWFRSVAIGVAPAGAVRCICRMVMFGNGGNVPYAWFVRPMLEAAKPTQTLPSAWNAGGAEFFASYTLALDVNGYVSGFQSRNTGTSSDFTILADKFKIMAPAGGARTEFSSGNWRVYDANNVLRVRLGIW